MHKHYANLVNARMKRPPVPKGHAPAAAASLGPAGPFRIHVVAEMTGIPEPTLRAGERRYGIPAPERTASGYRLYNLREVEQVRAMRAACDGGMSAAEAARSARAERDGREVTGTPPNQDAFESAQRGLIDAVERFDDVALEARLRQITFMGPSTILLDRIITPTLHEIGRRWHAGELSIAQEHLASQRIGKLLRDLMQLATSANGGARVVLGAFADDEHELGLLGLGLRLSTWGYRPIFLGARTPPGAIRNAVVAGSPSLVALSVTQTPSLARARELVEEYAIACGRVSWLVGGAGMAPIADLVRAHGGLVDPVDPSALRAMIRKEAKAAK